MWTKIAPKEDGWYWRRWWVNERTSHIEIVFIGEGEVSVVAVEKSLSIKEMDDSEWWPEKINEPV